MLSIQKVKAVNLPQIRQFLTARYTHDMTAQEITRLLDYRWQKEEDYCGYQLLAGETIVGFMGLIFSQRQLNGTTQKFCNLTTLYVEEDYRDRTFLLYRPVLGLREHTLLDLTPTRRVWMMGKRLGFRDLDAHLQVLLPFQVQATTDKIAKTGKIELPDQAELHISHDPTAIAPQLNTTQQLILQEHLPYACQHLLVRSQDRYCYIVYSTFGRKNMRYCYIHFISDVDFFAAYDRPIRGALLGRAQAVFGLVDARLIAEHELAWSCVYPVEAPKLYKPSASFQASQLRPEHIDNLYSELILLNHTTLNGVRTWWRDYVSNTLGRSPRTPHTKANRRAQWTTYRPSVTAFTHLSCSSSLWPASEPWEMMTPC